LKKRTRSLRSICYVIELFFFARYS
jgi:hypothetical protein